MRFFSVLCAVFFWANLSLANPLNDTSPRFNLEQANQQFDRINLQLSVQNLSLNHLNTAIDTLSKLIAGAEQCVDDAQKKLNNIDLLIKQGSHATNTNESGADLIYLQNEQKKLASKQAKCRLFNIRAKEAVDAYQTAVAQLKKEETFARELPLWSVVHQLRLVKLNSLWEIDSELFIPPLLYSPLAWALLVFSSMLIATTVLVRVHKSSFARRYLRIKKLRLSHIFLLTLSLIAGGLFAYLFLISDQADTPPILLLSLARIACLYLFSLMLITFIFKLKKVRFFFFWYSLDNAFFQSLLTFFLSFYTLSITGNLLNDALSINHLAGQLSRSLFLLSMLATAIYFIYYFCLEHRHLQFIRRHYHFIQRSCSFFLLACAGLAVLGYHTLALSLTFSALTTFAVLFITSLIIQGIHKLYLLLQQNKRLYTTIIHYFGYKKDESFIEFLILKITIQVIAIATGLYLIAQCWGFATYYIESAYTQFLYGFHFANFTFYPTRIVAGIVVFCLLYLLFRSISTALTRHEQFEDEEETQVAIASILTYIGFGFAVIMGLLVAGFNFTGLAIVAGALSVGIGLGLQSIVNNFVSGLILLIEKPIKPGDRIQVDGIEGTVKKIRVRSTQIITPARVDIIIPNSDLITRQVSNYMYTDRYLSVHCQVAVAYDSNTQLVKELLLTIASNHDEVIKTGRSKPSVLFCSFAEGSLVFQVWCLIKDANKKSMVQSDLNFAINEQFHKHGIQIALPQRDVHLITPSNT